MKRIPCLLFALSLIFLVSCGDQKAANVSSDTATDSSSLKIAADSVLSQMDKEKYRDGELLVKFRADSVAAATLKVHQKIGASVIRRYTLVTNLDHVQLPQGLAVTDAITRYMSDPNVQYAEPNYLRRVATTIPNDTYFNQQWALLNTGQSGGTAGADIRATTAWDITRGSSGIVIAVLDTGADFTHPDLAPNLCATGSICAGYNFVSQNNYPKDDNGHGTHVSGIIGAAGNNALGISGVMWTVRLMPLKFLDDTGSGSISDEIQAIQWAVANGAKVMNASFGGGAFSHSEYNALSQANAAGLLMVAAAGNGDQHNNYQGYNNDETPFYPASYNLPNIISVAATDQNDMKASFSNFGPTSVHVAAPGVYILSTFPASIPSTGNCDPTGIQLTGGYCYLDGTSMAAPHVTGLVGLLYSYYTGFTYTQVRSTVLQYVDVLPSLSGLIQTSGRINAYLALSSLLAPSGLSAIVSQTSTSQIALQWTDNATGASGYTVERGTASGAESQITALGPTATSFTDSSLIDGTTYYYRVRAFNGIGNSPYSNELSTTTLLGAPTGLTAGALSGTQVQLSWTNSSQTAAGASVERAAGANYAQVATVGPSVTTYTDSGLSPSTAYNYRVRAFNTAAGYSAYSNAVSVTTTAGTAAGGGGSSSGGGGGGCSISASRQTERGVSDIAIVLLPLLGLALLRRRK